MSDLRTRLVQVALDWQQRFGVAPHVTNAVAELDAALLVGMTEDEYALNCTGRTAVTKGFDFKHGDTKYQVKANRPSGGPGSRVTLVSAAKNCDWDRLIWMLYDEKYQVREAWAWEVEDYKVRFASVKRLSPEDMRRGGRPLHPSSGLALAQ